VLNLIILLKNHRKDVIIVVILSMMTNCLIKAYGTSAGSIPACFTKKVASIPSKLALT
jgi:hypothetical protein